MSIETANEILKNWQQQFPFALANYFWIAPSGKRLCVVREFDLYDPSLVKKYKNLEGACRFDFERAQFWKGELESLQSPRYPNEQIAAADLFGKKINDILWHEKSENEALSFYLACYSYLTSSSEGQWLKDLDFEVHMLLTYRASLVLLIELIFGARSFDVALEKARTYMDLCSLQAEGVGEYDFLSGVKNSEAPVRFADHLVFKRLDSEVGGRWNELSKSEIFFYSLNHLQFPTKYPTASQSLREHLVKSLEESGLPSAESFLASFEYRWVREANVS